MVHRLFLDHTFLEPLLLAHLSAERPYIPAMLDARKRQNIATATEIWNVFQEAGPHICETSVHEVERTVTNIFRTLRDHACACVAIDRIRELRMHVRVLTKAHFRDALTNFRSDDTREHQYEMMDIIAYTLLQGGSTPNWIVLAFHDHARAAQMKYGFNVVSSVNEAQSFAGLLGALGSYTSAAKANPNRSSEVQ